MSPPYRLLIVDDSPTQLMLMRGILEADGDFGIQTATNGREAFDLIRDSLPDLVLTDLQMPEMNGLELVENVKQIAPAVPVILTTSKGSEEIACRALEMGAASYVAKRNLQATLIDTIRQVIDVSESARAKQDVSSCLKKCSLRFELGNDEKLIPPVIARIETALAEMDLFDESVRMQISMALDEALLNGLIHGNLGIPSEIREVNEGKDYRAMIEKRTQESPYRDRVLHFQMDACASELRLTIEDEGEGFDISKLPDPTDPANLENLGGRGLLLINAFMDEVSHNESGNRIEMIKRVAGDGGDE